MRSPWIMIFHRPKVSRLNLPPLSPIAALIRSPIRAEITGCEDLFASDPGCDTDPRTNTVVLSHMRDYSNQFPVIYCYQHQLDLGAILAGRRL